MKSLPRLFATLVLSVFALGVLAGCSGMKPPGGKTLTSIAVTPATPAHLKVGSTQQFTATGTFSDGSMSDISASVTWTSGTTATATISTTGLATGVAAGTSSITASQGTVTSPGVTLTVIALQSIDVTPHTPPTIAINGTQQFTATGTYTDSSMADISSQVTWSCLPSSTATISAAGLATGVANGTAQVSASLNGIVSNSVTLTVGTGGTPVPVAVVIVQTNPTIAVGGVEDFTAQFLMSDGSLIAPNAAVTWSSGTTATATIIPASGIAVGVAVGTSTITAASTGLTSGTTTLTVKAAVSRFAYVSGQNDVASASYVVNSAANTLTPFGVLRDTLKPEQIVPEPSGRFAYAIGANTFGTVGVYAIDPTTGALTNTGTSFGAGQSAPGPLQAITDPTGRFLYIANSNTNNVTALQINTADGSLSCLGNPAPAPPCAATAVGSFPVGIAEDPTGKYVYVTNNGDGNISAFKTNADGSLTPLSTPTFSTGSGAGSSPGIPAIDPTGSFLYVPNSNSSTDATISVFSIAPATGLLTPAGTAVSTGAGTSPTMVAVLPSNKFLYVTDASNNAVIGMTITAGALSAPVSTPAGNLPQGLAMDVSGSFLVVANQLDNTLAYYTINGTSGALARGETVQTRGVPFFVNIAAGTAQPVIAPATVEAANSGTSNDISSYTVNGSSGALTAATASPTAGIAGNSQAFATQSGKFFYTASPSALKLGAFSIDSSAGLTSLSGSPVDLTPNTPAGIYADPSDQFVYVGDATTNTMHNYTNSGAAIAPNSVQATLPGLVSVNSIVGDAQGLLMIALGTAQLQPILIGSADGSLTLATVSPQAGKNYTAGAIDASGLFLVAVDSTGHNVESFSITPPTGATGNCTVAPFADGCVVATGSSAAAGTNGSYGVTFDPLNRFVFVADLPTGKVTAFAFNATTGAIGAGTVTTVTAPNGITSVAVDASGKFLYVGIPGATNAVPSTVAAYSIDSNTGALTAIGTPNASGTKTAAVTVTNSIN